MTAQEEIIRSHILAVVSESLIAVGQERRLLSDDFDLRQDGAIDSLGFIRLISELEARIAQTIDLADLPPEQLTKLGALTSHIARQVRPRS